MLNLPWKVLSSKWEKTKAAVVEWRREDENSARTPAQRETLFKVNSSFFFFKK